MSRLPVTWTVGTWQAIVLVLFFGLVLPVCIIWPGIGAALAFLAVVAVVASRLK